MPTLRLQNNKEKSRPLTVRFVQDSAMVEGGNDDERTIVLHYVRLALRDGVTIFHEPEHFSQKSIEIVSERSMPNDPDFLTSLAVWLRKRLRDFSVILEEPDRLPKEPTQQHIRDLLKEWKTEYGELGSAVGTIDQIVPLLSQAQADQLSDALNGIHRRNICPSPNPSSPLPQT